MTEILDIVNERDEVIGQIERSHPDKEQHIVRVIFIGFYTPHKQLILQRRGPLKKNAGMLTATVSGHVESGASYDETAVKEAYEESGISIDPARLVKLGVLLDTDIHVMRAVYAYPFDGTVSDLTIEEGEGGGFETMSVAEIRHARATRPDTFTSFLLSSAGDRLLDYIDQA
jgi:8-oxo-dGTP pyrophosphatase MutT (NUDIX family)